MEQKSMLAAVARTLEREFYAKEDARLLEKLRKKEKHEVLRELVQVEDDAFLERLIELGIGPETVLALTLVPLIAVAWADGTLDGRERDAIIKAAEEKGVSPGNRRTPAAGNVAFSPARAGIVRQLEAVRPRYLGNLHRRGASANAGKDARLGPWPVAEASGGFLGVISKVSPSERAVIKELENVLRVS